MSEWLNNFGEWVKSKITEQVSNKVNEVVAQGTNDFVKGTGKMIVNLEGLLIIVALVGVYFMIFGDKKWGTRLTSLSIIIFLLGEVLANAK